MEKNKLQPAAMKAGKAAEYLGISRRALHDYSSSGKIPYAKLSARLFLYRKVDLDFFLESLTKGHE